jgi:stage II sporulation protein D
MRHIVTFILSLFIISTLYAQQKIRIGLFQNLLPESLVLHCILGEYHLLSDDRQRSIKEGELVYISVVGDSLLLSDGDLNFGYYKTIYLKDVTGDGVIRLRPVHPAGYSGNYEGELELSLKHETLHIVNIVDFEKYLAGVVEVEGGPAEHSEFYKAQAILCRTYAIRNFNAHESEGFNLCDGTHCQAYKGRSEQNPAIPEAVLATHNLVLTGRYFVLINAVYHSNSGGETQRAVDMWTNDDVYLQAILDPFSKDQPNYKWEKIIPFDLWKNYLISIGVKSTQNTDSLDLLIKQGHRKKYFILAEDTVRIEKVRADFNLRSGFFDMELKNDSIVFNGKGYGHGVGLSQEGAMEMARQGFSFSDILRFYYHQVQIRDIANIPDERLPIEFQGLR